MFAARPWSGYRYDLIQVTGKVKIRNYKNKAVKMQLDKAITGTLKQSSADWEVTNKIQQQQGRSVNKLNKVCWEVTLKAGEEMVIEYDYEVYVRH